MPLPVEDDLARLLRALDGLNIRNFALTGGVAFGVWVEPRETRDLDVCGVLPPESVIPLLAQYDGVRAGTGELPDMVRFRVGDWDVDLFVAKSELDNECLARAVEVAIGRVTVKVVTAEDFVLHKLKKLRSDRRRVLQDVADLRSLFQKKSDIDWKYVEARVVGADRELLNAIRNLSDEDLIGRLER
ncbi:MAG: nucleotidyltransferase [Deltaproteobacteria bacterium]|nr:nucleotidyltransferase [Deltaproteobacteria bacterium]